MKKVLVRMARQSPALIVAMLALFVALTGTAVATTSALIGSAQIRNNSITGVDVKNRSLRPIDFRGSVRGPRGLRGLTGATGATGAAGAQGAQGVQGPIGPSNGYGADSEGADLTWTAAEQTVQTLNLPAGSYVLTGKVLANNDGAGLPIVQCDLKVGGVVIDNGNNIVPGANGAAAERLYLSQGAAVTLASASAVTIACDSSTATGEWEDRVLTAVKVGQIG